MEQKPSQALLEHYYNNRIWNLGTGLVYKLLIKFFGNFSNKKANISIDTTFYRQMLIHFVQFFLFKLQKRKQIHLISHTKVRLTWKFVDLMRLSESMNSSGSIHQ